MVKHELLIPQMAAQIVQYIVIGVGVLLFITGTYLVAKSGTKKRSKVRNPSFFTVPRNWHATSTTTTEFGWELRSSNKDYSDIYPRFFSTEGVGDGSNGIRTVTALLQADTTSKLIQQEDVKSQ